MAITICNDACSSNGCGFTNAASMWRDYGFDVIPIIPNTKFPAVKWDPWLPKLSNTTIAAHWGNHPDHEVGFIVGDNIIVFDADTPASIAALTAIELRFGIQPNLVVKTKKGEHHYFLLASGTCAKSDSHSTETYPERIDVKTGRALVILPPSTGKTLAICDATNSSELNAVGQDFIDAVNLHNGRPLPRPSGPPSKSTNAPSSDKVRILQGIIRYIDADCGYENWLHTAMAIHYETAGSDEGLALFDSWSSTGKKYRGPRETEAKWQSFRTDSERHFSIATLFWLAEQEGFSSEMIMAEFEPFEILGGKDEAE